MRGISVVYRGLSVQWWDATYVLQARVWVRSKGSAAPSPCIGFRTSRGCRRPLPVRRGR